MHLTSVLGHASLSHSAFSSKYASRTATGQTKIILFCGFHCTFKRRASMFLLDESVSTGPKPSKLSITNLCFKRAETIEEMNPVICSFHHL